MVLKYILGSRVFSESTLLFFRVVAIVSAKLLILNLLHCTPVRTLVDSFGVNGPIESMAVRINGEVVLAGKKLAY